MFWLQPQERRGGRVSCAELVECTCAGKRAGVVTNAAVTDATPAASYAHSAHRYWVSDADVPATDRHKPLCRDIAAQLVLNNSDIHVSTAPPQLISTDGHGSGQSMGRVGLGWVGLGRIFWRISWVWFGWVQ